MNRLPIDDLDSIYRSIPPEATDIKRELDSVRNRLKVCQDQYDNEQRSPPWLPLFREIIHYLGTCILVAGYIFRSARQHNKSVLTTTIRYAILAHEDILEYINNPRQFRRRHDGAENIIKDGMEERPIKLFYEESN